MEVNSAPAGIIFNVCIERDRDARRGDIAIESYYKCGFVERDADMIYRSDKTLTLLQ